MECQSVVSTENGTNSLMVTMILKAEEDVSQFHRRNSNETMPLTEERKENERISPSE